MTEEFLSRSEFINRSESLQAERKVFGKSFTELVLVSSFLQVLLEKYVFKM